MQQRTIVSNGKRLLVNVPSGDDGIGPGFAVGQLVMKSADDGWWYMVMASGSVGSVVAYVSQSALPFTSGPVWVQNAYNASIVGNMSFFEQNFPYQIVASNDGNAYCVYLNGNSPTVHLTVSQSVWGKAYITNSQNAIIDMAKPYLYLQNITDGNYYIFYLSSSSGVTSLNCDAGPSGDNNMTLYGHGTPVGSTTPQSLNQLYIDQDVPHYWLSAGLTSANWTQIDPSCSSLFFSTTPAGNEPLYGIITNSDIDTVTDFFFSGSTSLGGISLNNCNNLLTVTAPNLVSIDPLNTQGGGVNTSNCTSLTTLDLPLVTTIGNYVSTQGCTSLTTLNFPSVTTIGGDVSTDGCTSLTALDLPLVTTIGGDVNTSNCTSLTALDLPLMTTIGGSVNTSNCTSLTALDLPLMTTIGGGVYTYGCTSLTTFDLPLVTTIGGDVYTYGCTSLTTVDVSSWVPTNGSQINFSGDALNATSVELILRRCVLAGVTSCTVNLSGGTNAGISTLSVQGQSDAATLGGQLTINP